MNALSVELEPARHRWVARLPAGEAEIVYAPVADGVVELQHTYVPPAARGDHVGDALVRAVLADIRARGWRARVTCPYVGAWLRRHPEARDVVVP
ncbi:MAG TPA: GNAT family N-acetyltransferase [Gemmatimonadales bacterium]|nr:GNAT family N-acetyltransferase [Gemmatimonadales bacterium]